MKEKVTNSKESFSIHLDSTTMTKSISYKLSSLPKLLRTWTLELRSWSLSTACNAHRYHSQSLHSDAVINTPPSPFAHPLMQGRFKSKYLRCATKAFAFHQQAVVDWNPINTLLLIDSRSSLGDTWPVPFPWKYNHLTCIKIMIIVAGNQQKGDRTKGFSRARC